jgi:electron transfer flavoprotein beta subunit
MDIVVLMKQVPDTAALIEIGEDKAGIRTEDVRWVINPYDELGIEEAIRIRERQGGGKVTVLTVGAMSAVTSIRTAYAMGADEGILICDPALDKADALLTAKVLVAALRGIPFDLIIAGHRAVDDDCSLVPCVVSERLGLPLLSMVVRETFENGKIRCEQYLQDGVTCVEADLPALMTTQRGLNEPRLATLTTILKAKKTPVQIRTLADIGISAEETGPESQKMKILSLAYPPARKAGKIISGATAREKALQLKGLLREAGIL